MDGYDRAYRQLNAAQKKAVDTVDGPLLVLAGPGTGKTQLLTMRVAQILRTTDALPANILCLTFTESGAANMRRRLSQFIGREAYDVSMSTYHSFGGDLIRNYPDYFEKLRLERPVDELGKRKILAAIIDKLDYRNPLKQTRWHLGDLLATVSETKRALLTPQKLRSIGNANIQTIERTSGAIQAALADHVKRLPTKLTVAAPVFETIYRALQDAALAEGKSAPFRGLAELAAEQLEVALEDAAAVQKTTPLTGWKNAWLAKDADNNYQLDGRLESKRVAALADVLAAYEQALASQGLYDFDDMILQAIHMLETNPDLKYTLQERYQYILLDEFQDTNAAQLRLVELLTDNPVNERRPNILAVGDDDQAIYAFQGAQYSNMRDFLSLYDDVLLVHLNENYRSGAPILETARAVATQLNDSLSASIKDLEKTLHAARRTSARTVIERTNYPSDIAEREGIATRIRRLISDGTSPDEIAVLAPKHKYLEPLVGHLEGVPLRYEKREDILSTPVVRQLLTMSRLALALSSGRHHETNHLWSEVLSYEFWDFPVSAIWQLSWQAQAAKQPWTKTMLETEQFRPAALLLLAVSGQAHEQTLELMLDVLLGTEAIRTNEAEMPEVRSPLRDYLLLGGESDLFEAATQLAVLRARLREYGLSEKTTLLLADMVAFADDYENAGEQLLNTSPHNEAASAVQLMTAYKAKGLEFEHVFLISCHDDVWGSTARSNGNKLTLPANLAPIRHAGATEDERLRLFFVALTRAKQGLYLTSYSRNFAGKQPAPIKALDETTDKSGVRLARSLPEPFRVVIQEDADVPTLEVIEHDWRQRHTVVDGELRTLLQDRLETYRLSPTHLTSFIDLEHAGPQTFLLRTLLRFPSGITPDIAFGNAMHETLQWLQLQTNTTGKTPGSGAAKTFFAERIQLQAILPEQVAVQQARGEAALELLLAGRHGLFNRGDYAEYDFRDEAVTVGNVPLSGKIDLLQVDTTAKTIHIVDYKTGTLGAAPGKLHRYTLQLYCYALLVGGSRAFRGYTITGGSLVFVEPDADGQLQRHAITFDDDELARVRLLIQAVWQRIQDLDLPDTSGYASNVAGIKKFEQDLIDSAVSEIDSEVSKPES